MAWLDGTLFYLYSALCLAVVCRPCLLGCKTARRPTTSDVDRHNVIYSSTDNLSTNLRKTLDQLNEVMDENFRLKNQIIELQKSVDDLTYQVEQLSKK